MTNDKKLLYIPIETKVRELYGKLLFALIAAEKGFEAILGGQHEIHAIASSMEPGIYVDKSVAETKRKWFKKCRELGYTMCAWDEEGLVVFNAETHFQLRICHQVMENTKCFFSWGPSETESIKSQAPDLADKVIATGNPRFDMLRPEFRSFYDNKVDALKQRYNRIILVNTNFAFANFFAGDEKVQSIFKAYSMPNHPGFFDGWAAAQRDSMMVFKEMIPSLCKRFPDHKIVIRPHPSENFDFWRNIAKMHENAIVTGEGNVHEWILASEALVHFNCTTGIEAFFLGVPAISLRKPGHEEFYQPLPNKLSAICKDNQESLELLDVIINHEDGFQPLNESPERLETARKHISGMDGPLASARIVDILEKIDLDPPAPLQEDEPSVPIIKKIWRSYLKCVRRPDPKDIAYSRQKFPGLELNEIENHMQRFQQITNRFDNIQASQLAKNCFKLSIES
jgi:surface carbohydrate biosynthesis protein